jgi:hypothetical protein
MESLGPIFLLQSNLETLLAMIIYLFLRQRRHGLEHALLSEFRLIEKTMHEPIPFLGSREK